MIPNQNNSLYQELFSDDDISSPCPYEIKEKDTKEIIEKNEKSKKEEEKEEKKTEKPKKSRCYQCNKKLSMMSFTCKCDKMFCIAHQIPHNHKCSYNHKQEKMIQIQNNNPKMNHKFTPL